MISSRKSAHLKLSGWPSNLVKRNDGAPGIDGITIDKFEENLEEEPEAKSDTMF